MSRKGFTLIELLIVVAIIAVLAVIGVVVFKGVSGNARDTKRRADVAAIAKAYETKYSSSGSYQTLFSTDFATGSIPKTPSGGDYFNVMSSGNAGFKVCAVLEAGSGTYCNTSSSSCYCRVSSQGDFDTNASITGTGSEIGLGGSHLTHSPSCDPGGTLSNGLIGYWRMDETSWSGTAGDVKDSSLSTFNGNSGGGANTTAGKFNNAGTFTSPAYVSVPSLLISSLSNGFTWSSWVKTSNLAGSWSWPFAASLTGGSYNWFQCGKKSGNGDIRFETGDFTSNTALDTSGQNIADSNWHLLTCVWDKIGGQKYIYIDGSQKANVAATSTGSVTNYGNLYLGAHAGPSEYWSGLIDDLRVYNRALSSSEVSNLYNSGNGCVP